MKKTILSLALLGFAAGAMACGQPYCAPATASSSGTTASGVNNSTYSAAQSSGNGAAYQFNSINMTATATGANSATIGTVNGTTTGAIDLSGLATTKGEAVSYSETSGSGIATGFATGVACAKVTETGAFSIGGANSMTGYATGSALSQTQVGAATSSAGNGSAFVGNVAGTTAGFTASVDAVRTGSSYSFDAKTSEAWSVSGKDSVTSVTGSGVIGANVTQTSGQASAATAATVGNACNNVATCR